MLGALEAGVLAPTSAIDGDTLSMGTNWHCMIGRTGRARMWEYVLIPSSQLSAFVRRLVPPTVR